MILSLASILSLIGASINSILAQLWFPCRCVACETARIFFLFCTLWGFYDSTFRLYGFRRARLDSGTVIVFKVTRSFLSPGFVGATLIRTLEHNFHLSCIKRGILFFYHHVGLFHFLSNLSNLVFWTKDFGPHTQSVDLVSYALSDDGPCSTSPGRNPATPSLPMLWKDM